MEKMVQTGGVSAIWARLACAPVAEPAVYLHWSEIHPLTYSTTWTFHMKAHSGFLCADRLWTRLGQQAKQTLPWRHSLNDSFNSRLFLYSWEYYNPMTNISSSDLLNSTITTVHCHEMLFPVQILNDRFYGVWYWAGKTTRNDPLY